MRYALVAVILLTVLTIGAKPTLLRPHVVIHHPCVCHIRHVPRDVQMLDCGEKGLPDGNRWLCAHGGQQ